MTEGAANHMKKPGRKATAGNPAAARRRDGVQDKQRRGLAKWLSREMNAFAGLPPELVGFVGVLVLGGALALWRWLAG